MKLIAINGSPRQKGNTGRVITEAIKGAQEKEENLIVKEYFLQELELNPCIGCERCMKGLNCKFDGDKISEILNELMEADAVIIGSSIYFSQMTSQLKTLIDRCYSVFMNEEKEFTAKLTLFLTHGFPDDTYTDYLEYTLERTFKLAGFDTIEGLSVGGLHNVGELEETRPEILDKFKEIGAKLVS